VKTVRAKIYRGIVTIGIQLRIKTLNKIQHKANSSLSAKAMEILVFDSFSFMDFSLESDTIKCKAQMPLQDGK